MKINSEQSMPHPPRPDKRDHLRDYLKKVSHIDLVSVSERLGEIAVSEHYISAPCPVCMLNGDKKEPREKSFSIPNNVHAPDLVQAHINPKYKCRCRKNSEHGMFLHEFLDYIAPMEIKEISIFTAAKCGSICLPVNIHHVDMGDVESLSKYHVEHNGTTLGVYSLLHYTDILTDFEVVDIDFHTLNQASLLAQLKTAMSRKTHPLPKSLILNGLTILVRHVDPIFSRRVGKTISLKQLKDTMLSNILKSGYQLTS